MDQPIPETGLHELQAMIDGDKQAKFARLVGFRLIEVEPGRTVFESVPGEQHYNPYDIVHGGYTASLLDSAMGCAVHSLLPADTKYSTLELKINYVRPMTDATGPILTTGTVVHIGRRTAIAEGRIVDKDDKLIAHGTTTCIIL